MSLSRPHTLLLIALNALCISAVLLAVAVAGCAASPSDHRTFYVSPSGSDDASGRSPEQAWRTVTKASRADLQPGDTVLFRGGRSYGDDALMPEHSGTPSAPITFGSYGGGRASFPKGVWFDGAHDLTFAGIAVSGAHQAVNGTGDRITIEDSRLTNVSVGIDVHGSDWTIHGNTVARTGDSGLILQGDGHDVAGNRIVDTGRDRSIDYAKHGIYLKSSRTRVQGNVISRFSADGVSARYRDAVVSNNRITHGAIGIAWFQNDHRGGVSRWSGNRISSVSEAGMYVSRSDEAGPTVERFVITGNVVRTSATFMDLAPGRADVNCNTLVQRGGTGRRVCSAKAAAAFRG